jgi:hypothetical protein
MKRDEQALAGQLWIQGDRQMTATNAPAPGMANTREAALLSAAAEAVSWNHASQPDEEREGQRIIIFPKDLLPLEEFLASGDPNIDPEDEHPIAHTDILQATQSFENPPILIKEGSEQITGNPEWAEKVPEWMYLAAQVATGNRRHVLEDGPDEINSDVLSIRLPRCS